MTFLGSLMVLLGALWLLNNLGFISAQIWDIFWPAVLIIVGLKLLVIPLKWRHFWDKFDVKKKIKVE